MRYARITERLAALGGAKWELYQRARDLVAQGRDIVELTIGEPDIPAPETLIETAAQAMARGRTTYSNGRGEPGLRAALADRYSQESGRTITPDQVLCFPGTQTALFAVMMGLTEEGDGVLVGDPMYAAYEGAIRASGAHVVPVPLRPEHGFRLRPQDLEARVTPACRAILLTTPHNPTGAVLTNEDIAGIGAVARAHDLWIISDEVYAELIFDGTRFHSPLHQAGLAERTVVVSSISKSHAAPGFRSGWCIGPEPFTAALLSLSETMLFGNQPFIADMTEQAIREGSTVAAGMRARYARRAAQLDHCLTEQTRLRVHRPQAGMFALIDVSAYGLSGHDYALDLLEQGGVAVMPGCSFGETLQDWVRVALTVEDAAFDTACTRIIAHAQTLKAPAR